MELQTKPKSMLLKADLAVESSQRCLEKPSISECLDVDSNFEAQIGDSSSTDLDNEQLLLGWEPGMADMEIRSCIHNWDETEAIDAADLDAADRRKTLESLDTKLTGRHSGFPLGQSDQFLLHLYQLILLSEDFL